METEVSIQKEQMCLTWWKTYWLTIGNDSGDFGCKYMDSHADAGEKSD